MSLVESIPAVGELRANESVVITPEIAGKIERIHFKEGGFVHQGDLLVSLDASVAQAQVAQAQAEATQLRNNYHRAVDLAARKFLSDSAREQAASALEIAQAKLKLAQVNINKARIRAPFSGTLGLRNISIGDYVLPGGALVALHDLSHMKVDLRLPERFFHRLHLGQSVELRLPAGGRLKATIQAIDVQVDEAGRSIVVRGLLPNEGTQLRNGMFVEAALMLSQNPRAVMVPEEAVVEVDGASFVYRIQSSHAKRRWVETGARQGGKIEILSGLKAGDQVVVAGQMKLGGNDDIAVRVIAPLQNRLSF